MYYSYVEIEYVATSFSPARTDLALKLLMNDTILKTLDRKLKEIGNWSLPFGGFTIIFAWDFRQLEPVAAKDTELLFLNLSSQHWENYINAVIILDNEHCFKEDSEYGQMLKRMWSGDLTKEDRMRINTTSETQIQLIVTIRLQPL